MSVLQLRKRRYSIYKRALAALGIEIPDLKRPNIRSIQNVKKLWRRAKRELADAGVNIGTVDDVAKGKIDPLGELQARAIIGNILRLIEQGLAYVSPKTSQAGAVAVRNSALRLREIIEAAIQELGAEEVAKRLETWATGQNLPELIERLIYAVYDREFARWAHGRSAYETLLRGLAEVLEVPDIMSIIFS